MGQIWIDEFAWPEGGVTRPIGVVAGRLPCTVMLVGPQSSESATLVFQREVPATLGLDWKVMPYRKQDGERVSGAVARWCRLEVQVARKLPKGEGESPLKAGMELVLGRARASCWAANATFKNSNRKGPDERRNPLEKPASGIEEVIERLELLPYDAWEKGDYLTAGVSLPPDPLSAEDEFETRNYSRGNWILGACPDVESCLEQLRAEPKIKELLKLTEESRLRFWPSHLKHEVPSAYRTLHREAQDDATLLMEVSMRQALAGPDDEPDAESSMDETARESETVDWIGEPVTKLVEQIYKSHLYNRNRSLVSEDRELRELFQRVRECYNSQQRRRGRHPRSGGADV